jgi:topoisomerase-4 subunit B
MAQDLFASSAAPANAYDASSIEVLEGLEPVRRRPGMYVGGTDERALHHLAAEVLDNAMDEAVAGHATRIEVTLEPGNRLTITDNGRGIPVDPHPKFPDKSALEVILSTLHSGGKFAGKAYATSGGLHGVGVSVVNALSSDTLVEVARDRQLYRQRFSRGLTQGPLEHVGAAPNRRGTSVAFTPDTEIFGPELAFKPKRLYQLARSKAYLFAGVEIRWHCAPALVEGSDTPAEAVFQFPGGLADHLREQIGGRECATADFFAGNQDFPNEQGRVEWAVAWPLWSDGSYSWYCNTIPTPDGGTHEQGLRQALVRGLRAFGDLVHQKKAKDITADDVMVGSELMLSVFVREPQFQSQTKDRLTSPEAAGLVEKAVRDHFDHWLGHNMERGKALLGYVLDRMDERLRRKQEREVKRKTATSAKIVANQEIADLIQALGCGTRKDCDASQLRYERVVIMTDADVDGAHIATLLMTFFFQEMPDLVRRGHLYLAQPPLYRLTVGAKSLYARDDAHRAELERTAFKGKKVEVARFKGLGEMNPGQLRETTMDPKTRGMIRITLPQEYEERAGVKDLVDRLMGNNPAHRFAFIQENAARLDEEAIDA